MGPHHYTIALFSKEWFLSSGLTILLIVIGIIIGRKLSIDQKERLGRITGWTLLGVALSGHLYLFWVNKWTIQSSLPLHLCGISAILSGIVLLKRHQLAYECLYFWGIPGAFHSLLTPELTQGGEGYLYADYFLSHGGIILSALYLTMVLGMRPGVHSWWKIFLLTQVLALVIGSINWALNSNYMYLCHKPIADNPLVMGDWPWYIAVFELAAIVHFLLIYAPFWWQDHKAKRRNSTKSA